VKRIRVAIAVIGLTFGISVAPANPLPCLPSADRTAFRRWFTFLAESRYYARKPLPEVTDGDSLIRWAFRNALASHDFAWSKRLELPVYPVMPSIHRNAGAQEIAVLYQGTPMLVSRDLADAEAGDLLLYRNAELSAHVMVYIGRSQVAPSHGNWVVYMASNRIHKVTVDKLRGDPSPEWRPVAENPEFLGVWRLGLLVSTE